MQTGLFPFTQGAPIINNIVAKARALDRTTTPEFKELAKRIIRLSRALAAELESRNITVVSGGSDNHIVLANTLESFGVTGYVAEKALEECNLIVNKNHIPGDQLSPFVTSGIRVGTNSVAARGLGTDEMAQCADIIGRILKNVDAHGDKTYSIDSASRDAFRSEIRNIALQHPIPGYLAPDSS